MNSYLDRLHHKDQGILASCGNTQAMSLHLEPLRSSPDCQINLPKINQDVPPLTSLMKSSEQIVL